MKPNIFEIATSELSQDALITWLLKWADNEYSAIDINLHSCAKNFVCSLIEEKADYKISSIEAGRQWNNMDVWAKVNNDYFIVIEDKKGTQEHSNQLETYAEIAKEHYKNEKIKIILIYFKMEPQGDYSNVENAGFSLFSREKMLSILEQYDKATANDKQNDILLDYYGYLKRLDEQINSFTKLSTEKWDWWHSWTGFFETVQKEIGGEWGYVPNPSGGFLGLHWNWEEKTLNGKEFWFYLQLEYNKMVFKLCVNQPDDRREIQDYYRSKLYPVAQAQGIDISQYGRLGQCMGVAKLNDDYRVTDEKGLIDIPLTIKNLRKMEHLIKLVATEIDKE